MAPKTRTHRRGTTFAGDFLPLFIISLFLSHTNPQQVSAMAATRRSRTTHHVHRSAVSSTCSSSPPQGGLTISPRYGPCSPLQGNHHNNKNSSPSSILRRDQSRVRSINSLYKSSFAATATNLALDSSRFGKGIVVPTFGRSLGAENYVVTIGIGTPRRDLILMLDTGSDVSWVQCQPCSVTCYNQQDAIFDPKASSTFSADAISCNRPTCDYAVEYLDGSSSRGYFAKDKLTVSGVDEFPGFIFGCGQNNTPNFGQAAGVLGLGNGNGAVSFLSQTATLYAKIFCYCLPRDDGSSGYLLFGMEALRQCQTNKPTKLLRNREYEYPSLYFVKLNAITIGGLRVDFLTSTSSSPGTAAIDSGTVITRLPADVYAGVRGEFVKAMAGSYEPVAGEMFDTCYNMEGKFNEAAVPAVVMNFEGLDVELGSSAVVWREDGDAKVCLAFAENGNESGFAIVGNYQQRGLNVLYNVQNGGVEIGRGRCGS